MTRWCNVRLWLCVILLSVANLAISFSFAYRMYNDRASTPSSAELPKSVENLLADWLSSDSSGQFPNIDFSVYIEGADPEMGSPEDGMSLEANVFIDTFYSLSDSFIGYDTELVAPGFCIVRLLDAECNLIPPPVGVWYEVDRSTGKLSSWRVARLQPFSVYDEEYSELWERVYGQY